jgi:Uncharacterized conserved protein
MDIRLTQAARDQLSKPISDGRFLKIALDKSGCCSYTFNLYEDLMRPGDEIIDVEGFKLLIVPKVREIMQNVELDYGRRGVRKGYFITNLIDRH